MNEEIMSSGMKRKRGNKIMSSRERKRLMIFVDKLTSTTKQKIDSRLAREGLDGNQSNTALAFARLAYDLARSGTHQQIEEIESVALRFIVPYVAATTSASTSDLAHQCAVYGEAAFLLSLSGIRSTPSNWIDSDCPLDGVYSVLFQNALVLINSVCSDDSLDMTSEVPGSLYIVMNLLTALEYLAAAGKWDMDSSIDSSAGFRAIADVLEAHHAVRVKEMSCKHGLVEQSDGFCSPSGAWGWTGVQEFIADVRQMGSCPGDGRSCWLHAPSGRPLTALWKHSTKQKKVRSKDSQLVPGTRLAKLAVDSRTGACIWGGDSPVGFADMALPLVIDVGCGFGVSLLGLAVSATMGSDTNYLGCDLSTHCIAYARGLACRWDVSDRCRFCVAPAEDFLQWVLTHYPGPVIWVLLQFPTPYKLDLPSSHQKKRAVGSGFEGKCNSQLPVIPVSTSMQKGDSQHSNDDDDDDNDSGFMVTNRVVRLILDIAKASNKHSSFPTPCRLYMQSNVEDVAVLMKRRFESLMPEYDTLACEDLTSATNRSVAMVDRQTACAAPGAVYTKRQQAWVSAGGERAGAAASLQLHSPWVSGSPWGVLARTETEAAYSISNKPVFRLGWKLCSHTHE